MYRVCQNTKTDNNHSFCYIYSSILQKQTVLLVDGEAAEPCGAPPPPRH
jgi:hypothetical protein